MITYITEDLEISSDESTKKKLVWLNILKAKNISHLSLKRS